MKLGFIGAGEMANFHAHAFNSLGATIQAVATLQDGRRRQAFARNFNVPSIYDSWRDLVASETLDGLIVCTPPSVTISILEEISSKDISTLVEKPGALSSEELRFLGQGSNRNIFFAYNRRFYETVAAMKEVIANNSGYFSAHIVEADNLAVEQRIDALINNSVHSFDLINYLFPNSHYFGFKKGVGENVLACGVKNSAGSDIGDIKVYFGAIRNTEISWDSDGHSAILKPLEVFSQFNEFEIQNPSVLSPIRKYEPKWSGEKGGHEQIVTTDFKPGIYRQALDFLAVTNNSLGSSNSALATYGDAIRALSLAENFAEVLKEKEL
jgi:predicted dehydrogenase